MQTIFLIVSAALQRGQDQRACAPRYGNCFRSRCCRASGMTTHSTNVAQLGCFRKVNTRYAQCRPVEPDCVNGNNWLCPGWSDPPLTGSSPVQHDAAATNVGGAKAITVAFEALAAIVVQRPLRHYATATSASSVAAVRRSWVAKNLTSSLSAPGNATLSAALVSGSKPPQHYATTTSAATAASASAMLAALKREADGVYTPLQHYTTTTSVASVAVLKLNHTPRIRPAPRANNQSSFQGATQHSSMLLLKTTDQLITVGALAALFVCVLLAMVVQHGIQSVERDRKRLLQERLRKTTMQALEGEEQEHA
jgi:hypothetical protein